MGGSSGTSIGAIGETCEVSSPFGCLGHAQRGRIVCVAGKWADNGQCPIGENCDTSAISAGACRPIATSCDGHAASDWVCDGTSVTRCDVDLIRPEPVSSCPGQNCMQGACFGDCKAGTEVCGAGGLSRTCQIDGVMPEIAAANCGISPRSCTGLITNCGVNGDESCCTTPPIPGGSFRLDNVPGTTSIQVYGYRLDKFEVTVGRFRNFVAAYDAWRLTGAPAETGGWEPNWSTKLASDATALVARTQCSSGFQTWTTSAGGNETKPINCVTAYDALAFCIWDGGFLPNAEQWSFAAVAGNEQRPYPWGSNAPSDTTLSAYGCLLSGGATCDASDIAPVGSRASGIGRYFQMDLSGNIAEWTTSAQGVGRGVRGGAWDSAVTNILGTSVLNGAPETATRSIGFRCVRTL